MGRYCSVYDCKNKGTSTFSFPKDKTRNKQWEDFVNKTRRNTIGLKKNKKWKIENLSNACICSDHFEDSANFCFDPMVGTASFFNRNLLPWPSSLFLKAESLK